jgi:hypothetical protein
MVGDNQHYLPQLLLRGFLSDHREEYAWEFRKGCVEKKPIARIAFGFRFYGEPGEETPDECLTDRETRYGRVIAQIRKAPRD